MHAAPPNISLTLIARDEESQIVRCLQSVSGLDAEIIVVDTGSSDQTKQIAIACGAKVLDFTCIKNFRAARNHALEAACGKWILVLDADESIHNNAVGIFLKAGFVIENSPSGFCGQDHLFSGTAANTLRLAIAPDIRWQDRFVPFIDEVADSLANEVVRDGEAGQLVLCENFLKTLAVLRGAGSGIEVVSPTGEFESFVAHLAGHRGEFFEWKGGPLAGEERERAWYVYLLKL